MLFDEEAGSMATACERQQIASKQNSHEIFIPRFEGWLEAASQGRRNMRIFDLGVTQQ